MEIIDSQIHIWAAPTAERPRNTSTGHVPHGPNSYSAEQALAEMNAAGVDVAVIVPPSFDGDRNDVALAAVVEHPSRFLVTGRFPVDSADVGPDILAAMEIPQFIGVRLTFNKSAARWIPDGTIDWFWDFVSENAIPVTLYPVGNQLQLVGALARRYSRLKIAIDHLATGTPEQGFDHFGRIEELLELEIYNNVAVKVSGLPISFPTTYSPEVVCEVVDRLIRAFGPHRMFWGSDFTRNSIGQTYGNTLEVFLDGIAHLTVPVQELIMGQALREWFGLI